MNIQRFRAPTAREALALARAAFGDNALVLSNRQLANGVEVLAAAEAEVSSFEPKLLGVSAERRPTLGVATPTESPAPAIRLTPTIGPTTQEIVRADTEQLAMSTLSFQDYVRERMLRRQQAEAVQEPASIKGSALDAATLACGATRPVAGPTATPVVVAPEPTATAARHTSPALVGSDAAAVGTASSAVMSELRAMKQLMEDRFNTLSWLGQAKQNPVHSHLMLKLVRAGYSAPLVRSVLEPIPASSDAGATVRSVMTSLEHMLGVDASAPTMTDEGGVFALVGATGVGKTTTIAKLAFRCAQMHGAASVGLVTLDAHRPGAHEQLRAFGRSLGMVAHLAHDRAALGELLVLLAAKKMVLIDTPGIAPRDPRRSDLLETLEMPAIKRILLLNAGAHGDTLDEIASQFKLGATRQAILSKVDEAAKLGPALDTLMRHRLTLRGVANGQHVPDDWKTPDGAELVRQSMRAAERSLLDPGSADLDFCLSPAACSVWPTAREN